MLGARSVIVIVSSRVIQRAVPPVWRGCPDWFLASLGSASRRLSFLVFPAFPFSSLGWVSRGVGRLFLGVGVPEASEAFWWVSQRLLSPRLSPWAVPQA